MTAATARAAVWAVLADGRWHGVLELVRAGGGLRAPVRVHELRRGADGSARRILNEIINGESSYRWTCDCGALPVNPGPTVRFCDRCRAALRELGQVDAGGAQEPATAGTGDLAGSPAQDPRPEPPPVGGARQLGLGLRLPFRRPG